MKRDLDFVYQGLFLFSVRKFESFLEEQFIELACGRREWKVKRGIARHLTVIRRVQETRPHRIRELIKGPNDYPQFLPYKRCIELAEIFFEKGRPFSLLNDDQKGRLTKCQTIRNLIAHDSEFARKKFEQRVLAQNPLPRYARNPAGYLRSNFRANQTFLEAELVNLLEIANFLS